MRLLIFLILLLSAAQPIKAQAIYLQDEVDNGNFILRVKNNLPCPSLVTANPDSMDRKFEQFVPKGSERTLIKLPIDSLKDSQKFKGQLRYDLVLGNPNAIPDPQYQYMLPFPEGKSYKLIQGNNSNFTHNEAGSKYAFDFGMPEGSMVTAVRGGVVGYVKQSNKKGGNDKTFRQQSNQILVCHEDGTVAIYGHLKYNGAVVDIGDNIFAGQVIGFSGNTGYSTTPHLHFVLMAGQKSIPVRFKNLPDSLETGLSYKHDFEF